jgi:hypothetical protein
MKKMKNYRAIAFAILSLMSVFVSGQNFVPTKIKQAITDFDGVEIPAGSVQLTDWKSALLSKFWDDNADVPYYSWDEKTKACSLYVVSYEINQSNEMGAPEFLTLYVMFASDFEDCKLSGVIPKFTTKEYFNSGKPWEKEYASIYTDPYHTKCGKIFQVGVSLKSDLIDMPWNAFDKNWVELSRKVKLYDSMSSTNGYFAEIVRIPLLPDAAKWLANELNTRLGLTQ